MKKDYVATIDNYVIVIHNSPDYVDAALEMAWSENPELEEFEVDNANVEYEENARGGKYYTELFTEQEYTQYCKNNPDKVLW